MLLSDTLSNKKTIMARNGISIEPFPSFKSLASSTSFPSSPVPSSPHPIFLTESMIEDNIQNAESIITKWDPNSSSITSITSLFHHNRKEAKEFLISVKDLRRAMHYLVSHHAASEKLVHGQNLMQTAMKRLEKEFYQILSLSRNQLDPETVSGRSSDGTSSFEDEDETGSEEEFKDSSESSIAKPEKISVLAMSDLKSIADCMISSGYGKECVKIYKLVRKSIVDEGLYLLGIDRFRSSQIQKMNWEALEYMIKNWLNAVKIAVNTLFNGEKILCDHVFSASQNIRESCFSDITTDGAVNLFRFPELVAKNMKIPQRIFPLMELHEALSDLWPEIELIFNSELTSAVKLQALSSLHRLGESVRSTLSDFESSIRKDSSKTPIAGGGIHPLTRTAMSYISSLADYSGILSNILADSAPPRSTPLPESYFKSPKSDDGSTPLVSLHLARLILVLLCKLDGKLELVKDMSLSYLFLANNLQFIIDKVCTSQLKVLLGEDWVFSHAKKVKLFASNYETIAWTKVLSSLPDKTSPKLSPEAAKECFRRFNAAFEEAYKKQTSWIVPKGKLRDELKMSIEKKLVPVYREFYDTYLVTLSGEKNLELLVRFGPDELGNYISDLFRGTGFSDLSQFPNLSISSSPRPCTPR